MTMKPDQWFAAAARFTVAGAVMLVAACSTQGPSSPPLGAGPSIEHARSRPDHQEIAAQYERQALADAAAAKRHLGYAAIYRRNVARQSGAEEHAALAKHCESLARTYQQAADENNAAARLHRQLAAEAK